MMLIICFIKNIVNVPNLSKKTEEICMTDEKRYICKNCGFKWFKNGKEYECPTCGSKYISLIAVNESPKLSGQLRAELRGEYGKGMRSGHLRVYKCPKLGYEV
jgi:DNA-directed RNA polymerase subunit RPC12/RpoP